ncbi:EF-Hand domain protein [Solidesulfovibrio fructosivorans JJ]]|uniref:EF-Hand domain protein n=1 Tax=Solidesulfovibrio fructosivorans JJ] TaxID=596151 RepID=E1K1S7_SOLFR|nr:EF-hand domain-containing protein [Solidesulfovibrio fructosivorans]EFL49427.1 EF-Hand domain protein [Solidesulfovibrio fructosivorans JJ]]
MVRYVMGILAIVALIAALGGCAKKQSQQHPKGYATMDEVYLKYDVNKDGVITKDEFVAQWKDKQKAENAWKKLDVKNNGFVDRVLNNDAPVSVWNDVESQNTPY